MNLGSPDTSMTMMQATQQQRTLGVQEAARNFEATKKDGRDPARVEEAAKEFEAVFIGEMLKPMFEGISSDGMFGGGKGEEVFQGMLVQEYGKIIARTGSIGFSAPIKEEMIRMQEKADNAAQEIKQ
jgi:flagellar protein FlgJ